MTVQAAAGRRVSTILEILET